MIYFPQNICQKLNKTRKFIVLSLGVATWLFCAPVSAQEQINLVPEDDSAVAQAPLEEPAALEGQTQNAVPVNGATADALTLDEPMAPEAAQGGDEFAFDDSVDYEKSSEDVAAGFRKQAFENALNQTLPLKPEEIRTVLEHYDRTIQSTEVPVHPYPRPELAVQNVALDPGSLPLVIKLAFGYVTTMSILDASGKPWPIEDMSWVGDFEIHEDSANNTTHMLRISPSSNFAHGNISMRLVGLDTPVIFTFETNRDVVHYRFDAIIPKEGPNTATPIIDRGPVSSLTLTSGDVDMSRALGGVVPEDAKRLVVSGVDGRTSAYNYNGLTYVRTPYTLLSPGWESSVTSADGTNVYALESAPVLILSDKGRMLRAHLSESMEP